MNTKDFIRLGIPLGEATRRATDFVSQFILSGGDKTKLEEELKAIIANPALFAEDPMRKKLAKAIVNAPPPPRLYATHLTSFWFLLFNSLLTTKPDVRHRLQENSKKIVPRRQFRFLTFLTIYRYLVCHRGSQPPKLNYVAAIHECGTGASTGSRLPSTGDRRFLNKMYVPLRRLPQPDRLLLPALQRTTKCT